MGDAIHPDEFFVPAPGDGTFRILQLTDFHNDVDETLAAKTHDAVRAMVAQTCPGFLAITGDIWCADDKPDQALKLMDRDLALFAELGVPWSFAWGNHDYVGDIHEALVRIASTPNAVAPRGDGRGSFRLAVTHAMSRKVLWDLYFLNSGPTWNLPHDIQWFEEEARRCRKERGAAVPALVFVHIPLFEYERARLARRYTGEAHEEVLHWGDDGQVLASFKRAGIVRGCFVGHSHRNDFHFEQDGITLAYGRATGYGGYGGDRLEKGAKLIVLDTQNGTFTFSTVFPDGTSLPA